jgi:hypothetical protein
LVLPKYEVSPTGTPAGVLMLPVAGDEYATKVGSYVIEMATGEDPGGQAGSGAATGQLMVPV